MEDAAGAGGNASPSGVIPADDQTALANAVNQAWIDSVDLEQPAWCGVLHPVCPIQPMDRVLLAVTIRKDQVLSDPTDPGDAPFERLLLPVVLS